MAPHSTITAPARSLHLFEGFGVELEYMIVDSRTLSVMPVSDRILEAAAGSIVSEVDLGEISWSNELVLHVIELKTNGPAGSLEDLPWLFQRHVARINELLEPLGGKLMPGGMHPWMHPGTETRLWPHEFNAVYTTYNRIFECRGHGWSNLQSLHLNLPFSGDEEFGRLHAAIRLLLPILPALAASSPVYDGQANGILDNRLEMYRRNQARIPSITGEIIPEPIFDEASYRQEILERIYRDVAPFDPEGTIQHEWLTSRGAIARVERDTIARRLSDGPECPLAELAISWLIVEVLKQLTGEHWLPYAEQRRWPTDDLAPLLLSCTQKGENADLGADYLAVFQRKGEAIRTAGDLWNSLFDEIRTECPERVNPWRNALKIILSQATLATRILKGLAHHTLGEVYASLSDSLTEGRLFAPCRSI